MTAVAVSLMLLALQSPPSAMLGSAWQRAEAMLPVLAQARRRAVTLVRHPLSSNSLVLTLPLIALFVFGVFQIGLTTYQMRGDQTLTIYAAQTIAAGQGPYAGYVLMHPPLAYMLSAAAILAGRLLRVSDELAVRTAYVLMDVVSLWLTYLVARQLSGRRVVALLAAAAFGWTVLMAAAVRASNMQQVTILCVLLMVLAVQNRRWAFGGAAAACALMSWAGAPVLAPVVFVTALAQSETPRWPAVRRAAAGFLLALGALALYLAAKGTLVLLWQQYMLGVGRYVANKVLGQGPLHDGSGPLHVLSAILRSLPSLADRLVLAFGVAGTLAFILHRWQRNHRLCAVLADPRCSPVIVASLLLWVGTQFDFQTAAGDLGVLIPFLSVMAGWLAWHVIVLWLTGSLQPAQPGLCYALALLTVAGLSFARLTEIPAPTGVNDLAGQRKAAEWLDQTLGRDRPIQAFGDLSLLVHTHRRNATRVIQLGPKSVTAMAMEGQSLPVFLAELEAIRPSLIIVDGRNLAVYGVDQASGDFLAPFRTWLPQSYCLVARCQGVKVFGATSVFARAGEPDAFLTAAGVDMAWRQPLVMQADELISEGRLDDAAACYRQAASRQADEAAPLVLLGDLYVNKGDAKRALAAYLQATLRPNDSLWAHIALTRLYARSGDVAQAEQARRAVASLGDSVGPAIGRALPSADPALLTVRALLRTDHLPLGVDAGDGRFLLGSVLDPEEAPPGGPVRLTLFWWTLDPKLTPGTVALRWLDTDGSPIDEPLQAPTVWSAGYVVRWTYELAVPVTAAPGSALQVAVRATRAGSASEASAGISSAWVPIGTVGVSEVPQ
ncbi:MAG: tetratricopeptide repeat protein [Anaerolineae bacterium]